MRKFLLTYWAGIVLLFASFYWEVSPLSNVINILQTNLTAYLTSLTLPSGMLIEHRILINTHYALVIEKACNGMIPYLFFLASIIAFPSSTKHTIKWAIMGYIFITFMNIFRIWCVTLFVLEEESNFSLAHDYLGNGILILTGLLLFTSFVKTKSNFSKQSLTQNSL